MKKDDRLKFKLYKQAPLFIGALLLMLGTWISVKTFMFPGQSNFFDAPLPTYAIGVILFILILACGILYGLKRKLFPIVLLVIVAIGFLYTQAKIESGYYTDEMIRHTHISGKVIDVRENGQNSIALKLRDVKIQNEDKTQSIDGNVSLIVYGESGGYLMEEYSFSNSVISAEATLIYPSGAQDKGFRNERLNMLSENVYYKSLAHYATIDIVETGKTPKLIREVDSARSAIYGNAKRYIGESEAEFVMALLTGNKSGLDADVKSDFSMLGISHLLATSGLHIGILLLAFEYFFKKLRAPIVIRAIISVMLVVLFLFFAGFRVSMVRAALMWALLMVSKMSGQRLHPLNSLGFAMIVLQIINPMCIFDISFVLSCVSVAAIAIFSGSFEFVKKLKRGRNSAEVFIISICVILFSWPVIAYYFNSVPWVSPVFNIIFVPLSSLALLISMLFGVLSQIPFLASALGALVKGITFVILRLSDFLVNYSPTIKIISPPIFITAAWFVAAATVSPKIFSGRGKYRKIISVTIAVFAILSMAIIQSSNSNREELIVYSDGSKIFLHIKENQEDALILNDESYLTYTVISKNAKDEIDTLVFSGNSSDKLKECLDGLAGVSINNIYAPHAVAHKYNIEYEGDVMSFSELAFGRYAISVKEFKAKSKTSKTHYALLIEHDGMEALYLDPLSIREGAFNNEAFDTIICSKWTKSRAQNVDYLNFLGLYYTSGETVPFEATLALENTDASIYNVYNKAHILFSKD